MHGRENKQSGFTRTPNPVKGQKLFEGKRIYCSDITGPGVRSFPDLVFEVDRILHIRFMAFVTFLLQTGARIGEVLSIDIDDIDRENREVKVIGKGRKPRTLFLRDETLYWIDRYLAIRRDHEKALFATQDGRSRWQQTDVGRSFRRYKKMSGIRKEFVIHTLRHTFATQYLMKGAGINVVQTALGHSDPVTTLKYYAATVEKAKVREMINDRHFDFIPEVDLATDT